MMKTNLITSLTKRTKPLYYLCRHGSTAASTCSAYDLVIVGGGIVGCATAREMIMRHPNMKMAIVEKENVLAMHQTGHNSGVIHAGIYYTPGSMKGERALWSPWTGIVDWAVVCKAFAEDFKKLGGEIFLNFEVIGFAEMAESKEKGQLTPISVQSKNRCIPTKYVLTCAGLHSDRLAVMTGCDVSPRIVPFRGEYLLLNDNKRHLCTTNVYPVPDARFPFLGVHFTPRVTGEIWLGPNAVLAFAREGYSWFDINMRDCIEMARFPGLYKLCFRYFIPGCQEVIKSIFYPLAVKDLQKFIPEVTYKDVKRGPAGVRAQALDKDGKLVDDFVFDGGTGAIGSRVLHCRNAPSPAATSCLAIAKFIADKLDRDFKL
ncbi:L-2-hydroxyglutarate dehydrogenase, mitochondrial isoform X2 [Polyergus mexicanus]|uniref:L-2-hydroxyglutarate dehydrogenase, mitochondrial isoform X2 n=1 Tax=Polyergus mexicanus TaxID=615972 RepID=UPI0038B58C89